MITNPALLAKIIIQAEAHFPQALDRFENREAVSAAPAQVINFSRPRRAVKFEEYRYDIVAVDLIADLLALVTKDRIVNPLDGAHNYICQIAMQFDCGMLRSGQAAAAKDSDWHIEITAKFLAKHV